LPDASAKQEKSNSGTMKSSSFSLKAQFVRCAIIELQRNGLALKCCVEDRLEGWRRTEKLIGHREFLAGGSDCIGVIHQDGFASVG
jgi:hypothetical protein